MTKAWLLERFGAETAPGWSAITETSDEEHCFVRTGGPAAMCWAHANEVIAELGDDRAVITGYFCAASSISIMSTHAEGHDLAIVDGRFLVDGWIAHVVGIGPCVLDLADPADLVRAVRIHEPFGSWTVFPDILETRIAA